MLARAVNERTKDFTVSSVKAIQETISEEVETMDIGKKIREFEHHPEAIPHVAIPEEEDTVKQRH